MTCGLCSICNIALLDWKHTLDLVKDKYNKSCFIILFIFPMSVESQTNNFTLFADHVIRMKIGTLFLV